MAVDFSRFSNTDFSTTPFQYVIFGKNGGLLEVELNEAQYLGFIRDSIALKNIGNRCSNATITVSQNGTITSLKGDFILNGYAIHSVDTSFNTKVNDIIYAKVSLETLDKDSEVTKNGVVGGVSIDNTILDNRVQIETTKRKAIRLEINTTGGEGFVKIAYVHSKKRAVLTLDTIDLSDRFLSTIESLRYSGYLNAFDGDFTDGYYETNGGKPIPSNTVGEYHSVMTTNFIPCEPFEKIKLKHSGTLKRDGSSTFLVLFYDSDKNFLPNKCIGSSSSDTSYVLTVPSGAYYFRFNVASDDPVMSIDVVEDVTVIRHYSSQVLPNGTVVSSNADFAEVAMWSDKNPYNEDRLGYFVSVSKTEDVITITKATSTSDVRGVTISNPAFSANAGDDKFENENLKKEYDFVAFAGFGTVIDNGTCTVNERCIPDDNGCAVPSTNSMGYQVIERVDDTHILILVEPNADMLKRIKDDIDALNEAIGKKASAIDLTAHTGNKSNPHGVTKEQVGLGNVENKSSATIRGEITKSNVTTALGYTPLNQSLKGSASGLAELDSNGKVPSSQLPSFLDDVIEGYLSGGKFYKESSHTTEISGESGKIYIDLSTEKTYRWSGSTFVIISETLALGETSSTAYRGDRGKTAYDHSQSNHARVDATKVEASSTNGNIKINGTETNVYTHPSGTNPHGTTKSDVGLGNVGDFKAVSTVASQGLSDTEKSNARANIGAGTSSFSGSYNDLTNKPTIPTVGNGAITIKQAGATKGTFTTNQSGDTTIELTDNNTTYGVATSSALGLVKSGTDITVDSSGNVSVNDDSHNHVISNVDGLQSALDGKADSSHTHNYLPLSGGTVIGATQFNNYLKLNAWSGYGTGTANFWYDANNKFVEIEYATDLKIGGTKVSKEGHTHSYAGSSSAGGSATSAEKLTTDAGSAYVPVYFTEGKPAECNVTNIFTDTTLGGYLFTAGGAYSLYGRRTKLVKYSNKKTASYSLSTSCKYLLIGTMLMSGDEKWFAEVLSYSNSTWNRTTLVYTTCPASISGNTLTCTYGTSTSGYYVESFALIEFH